MRRIRRRITEHRKEQALAARKQKWSKDRNGNGHVRMRIVAGDRRTPMRNSKNATLEMKRMLHVHNKRRQNKKSTNMKVQEYILVNNYNNPLGTKMTTRLHLHHAPTPQASTRHAGPIMTKINLPSLTLSSAGILPGHLQ